MQSKTKKDHEVISLSESTFSLLCGTHTAHFSIWCVKTKYIKQKTKKQCKGKTKSFSIPPQ